MSEKTCCLMHIYGKVQGVWFRETTRQKAEELGITGWVRNLTDGSVEAQFHGDATTLAAMVSWCHRGPPLARVDKVESLPCAEETTPPTGFTVLKG